MKAEEATFPTVLVRRVSDGKEMEMSRKVWENVHRGGTLFEEVTAKAEKEKK